MKQVEYRNILDMYIKMKLFFMLHKKYCTFGEDLTAVLQDQYEKPLLKFIKIPGLIISPDIKKARLQNKTENFMFCWLWILV